MKQITLFLKSAQGFSERAESCPHSAKGYSTTLSLEENHGELPWKHQEETRSFKNVYSRGAGWLSQLGMLDF